MTFPLAIPRDRSPSQQGRSAASEYRADIDGLRSLAVVAVILFHLNFRFAQGGFLGVDIFFVISGYLIGRQIITLIDEGRFSFKGFYEKRVRRIIPAIVAMIVFTHLVSFLIFTTSDYVDYSRSQIAQAFFVSNFYFMFTSGYFDQLDAYKPILHTWTLSIEEQFYLFAPVVLLLCRRSRWRQAAAVIAITAASLLVYLMWNLDPHVPDDVPFYNSISRVWQIGVGTLLAFVSLRDTVTQDIRPGAVTGIRILCILALALSIVAGGSEGSSIAWWTILATTAASGLIYLRPVHRDVFAHPAPVFVGKISFGLYLWHWPLIVFLSMLFSHLPRLVEVGTILLSFAAAIASYRFLETPIRRRQLLADPNRLFAVMLIAMASLTFVSVAAVVGRGWPSRIPAELTAAYAGVSDKNTRWDECFAPANWQSHSIDRISNDRPCKLGGMAGEPRFALIGDSHANAIMPLFDKLASRTGTPGAAMLYSGCPPLSGIEHVYETGRECTKFNREAFSYIRRHSIKTVYLAGYWDHYLLAHEWDGVHTNLKPTPIVRRADDAPPRSNKELEAVFEGGLRETLKQLPGVKVYIIGQVPQQNVSVPQALIQAELLDRPMDDLLVTREQALARARSRAIFARHLSPGKVEFIDTVGEFCRGARCEVVRRGIPLYYDDNHLSTHGASELAKTIAPTLPRANR